MEWVEGTQVVIQVLKSRLEHLFFFFLLIQHEVGLDQHALKEHIFRVF